MVWEDPVTDEDPIVDCSGCGTTQPRSEMFGVEPDLLCARCASGVRRRMHVRYRPIARERRPYVTIGAIAIAAVLFLLDTYAYPNPYLLPGVWPSWWEALYLNTHAGPAIWDGHVWTLLGAAFYHGGLIHIFFNCWWLLELGRATENGFGHLTLLAVIVGGAMVATGLEWVVNGPGIGLSGVVYALAFFLWAHHKTNPHAAMIMNRRTINFLAMWFVVCIALTLQGTWNIANWAHGGGGLWGWGFGLAMLHRKRRVLVPLALAATLLIVFATTQVTFGHQTILKRDDKLLKDLGADQRARLQNWMYTRPALREKAR